MSFDFPASPTEGQLFQAPGGPMYVFKSPVWNVDNTYAATPPGAVMMFPRDTAPPGWLKANGALISRSTYAALFAMVGTTFGAGDGSTTFALPDLRGEFLRAWDDGRGIDASRTFGSAQVDGIKTHDHAVSITSGGQSADHTHLASGTTGLVSANHTHTQGGSFGSGTESADHVHQWTMYNNGNASANPRSEGTAVAATGTTGGRTAAHGHTTTISGQTGTISANHSHTFSDTTDGASVGHTHAVAGTSAANTGAIAETRPRNVALLACIKY